MEKIARRGASLLRRPLCSTLACTRYGASFVRQRLPFSSCSSGLGEHPPPPVTRKLAVPFGLPDTPCRTRFAPSPTGYLHLGSLRTALLNYLLARATGGQFVLRIEDTDQTRRVADAEEKLYEDLEWVGLSWDEGPDIGGPYGPYRQSERLPLYKEHAEKLLREGKAYRCFCSPEALEQHKMAAHEAGRPTVYPGTCRHISPEESDDRAHNGEQFAIRFKSSDTPPSVQDIIFNRFRKEFPEEDYVIMKRDGFPTYHFASVVDDRHMKITHVIRGAEWLISTPKHVDLYNAFGWEPPQFAHLGLLVDERRQKLSKRENSANVAWYREQLVLPSALLNYSVSLGTRYHSIGGSDIMSLQEMIDNFSFKISRGNIKAARSKLAYFQARHVERLAEAEDRTVAAPLIKTYIVDPIKSQIEAVQKAKNKGRAMAPYGLKTVNLGRKLPTLGLLDERFHKDLIEALRFFTPGSELPKERLEESMVRLRYFFWEIPEGVLDYTLRKGPAEPFIPVNEPGKVGEALAYVTEKICAVHESDWNRHVLGRLVQLIQSQNREWWDQRFSRPDKRLDDTDDIRTLLYKTIRWALQAMERGPPVPRIMEILGREQTLRRLEVAQHVAGKLAAEMDSTAATQPLPPFAVKAQT
ncbi:mitochondrial putative glutamate--tRNA ligase [Achaetomium macrosporum]|uniref:Glutamate--tRNA ligase, mitochondrial n=1 Tax=Achaetomium macrosporum TaxID=79813 RepID=A0AAN7HIH2_9PEZI|nr:mitochondrial putative glutamate--tRNA ligase [Achaetomium macrosporum]